MNICSINSPKQPRQQGFALAIAMILLVVITMISLTAMRSANLDTKIAINHQHKQTSFQAADSALYYLLSFPKEEHRTLNVITAEGDFDAGVNVALNTDFVPYNNTAHSRADLFMTMSNSKSKEYKFSGYLVNAPAVIYQADAMGSVDNTNAVSHNRMEVALIIDE